MSQQPQPAGGPNRQPAMQQLATMRRAGTDGGEAPVEGKSAKARTRRRWPGGGGGGGGPARARLVAPVPCAWAHRCGLHDGTPAACWALTGCCVVAWRGCGRGGMGGWKESAADNPEAAADRLLEGLKEWVLEHGGRWDDQWRCEIKVGRGRAAGHSVAGAAGGCRARQCPPPGLPGRQASRRWRG